MHRNLSFCYDLSDPDDPDIPDVSFDLLTRFTGKPTYVLAGELDYADRWPVSPGMCSADEELLNTILPGEAATLTMLLMAACATTSPSWIDDEWDFSNQIASLLSDYCDETTYAPPQEKRNLVP